MSRCSIHLPGPLAMASNGASLALLILAAIPGASRAPGFIQSGAYLVTVRPAPAAKAPPGPGPTVLTPAPGLPIVTL